MRKPQLLAPLLVALLVSSCAQAPAPTNASTRKRVSPSQSHGRSKGLAPSEVAETPEAPTLDEDLLTKLKHKDVVILDVRDSNEYINGHLKGALNIDFMRDDFEKRIAKLDRRKRYVIYCSSGNRSGKALRYFLARKMKAENLGTFTDLKNRGALVEGVEEKNN